MKQLYANALVPNETITTQFLVTFKEIRQKKTGEPYLSLTLADRTGEIDAKMWDNVAEVMSDFERDDFVKVKGIAQLYQNKHQFTIYKIRRLDDAEVEPEDYFPSSARGSGEMFAELQSVVQSIGNPFLRQLLETIFADEKTAAMFRRAPAAKSIHHAYLGGLLEHVLSLCSLCKATATNYPDVDLDLLLSAAILHDIGKTEELSYSRSFAYSTAGQLLGHIAIGAQLVSDVIRTIPGFPPKLKLLLEHIILSHHGELQYGSPKVPVFLEALLFHHLDNLDSKMEAMRVAISRDKNAESEFTSWVPALERTVLKKAKFLEEEQTIEKPAAAPEPAWPDSYFEAPEPVVAQIAKPAPAKIAAEKPGARLMPASPFGEKLQAVLGSEFRSKNN